MSDFLGIAPSQKFALIRKLVEQRAKEGLFSRWFVSVGSMRDEDLIGLPEATIVTIVEMYSTFARAGLKDQEIFDSIEAQRSMFGVGSDQHPPALLSYVTYRIRLEHDSGRRITDNQIARAVSITQSFIERFCLSDNSGGEQIKPATDHDVSPIFMAELPHPEQSKPEVLFKVKGSAGQIAYYENPKTIGEVSTGVRPPYRYPQVAVLMDDRNLRLIFRLEQNATGASFLCAIKADGSRANFGPFRPVSREAFLKKMDELVSML